eukprot:355629_1
MGFQDENGGLEAWDKYNKKWIDIPYKKNAMIVNLGDAMQRWSNDRFIANFHRVKSIKKSNQRFSYYIFIGPHGDQIIDPKVFGVNDSDLIHQPSTFGEYFEDRKDNTYHVEERNDQFTGDHDALSCPS